MSENKLTEINYWQKLTDLMGESFVQYVRTKGQLENDLLIANNYYQKLIALKNYYESNKKEILDTFYKSRFLWFITYPTDWKALFTEIEFLAWCSIREKGRIVLYPQFPVENYFIDFANPGLKIGLELDGKDFHDKEKDRQRDLNLKSKGWTIYRISGREMCRTNYTTITELDYNEISEREIQEKLSYWLLKTGDGVIHAIKQIYFDNHPEIQTDDEDFSSDSDYEDLEWQNVENIYQDLCRKTLENHIFL